MFRFCLRLTMLPDLQALTTCVQSSVEQLLYSQDSLHQDFASGMC